MTGNKISNAHSRMDDKRIKLLEFQGKKKKFDYVMKNTHVQKYTRIKH